MPELFTEDEFIVILDHYFSVKEGGQLAANRLSEKLHSLHAVPDPAQPAHRRTDEGLRNVIGSFAAVDPAPPEVLLSYAERLAGEPLTEYRRVWAVYAHDPGAVRLRAIHALAAVSPGPASGSSPFELGRIYNRQQEIHGVYGGQKFGGISTPSTHPLVLIFSGDEGAAFGYADEELPDGGLIYFGEGQSGDMQMVKGNRAIRDHAANGRSLHLFKKVSDGYAQYAGEYEYVDHEIRANTPDGNGELRDAIAFKLRPRTVGPSVPPEIADAVDAVNGIAKGRGFSQRLKASDRKALELRAMALATEHYQRLGFDVEDVSANQPYDLRCTRDTERVDVEVKGTTTLGETVLLTPNEVKHALTRYPNTALAIVRHIRLRFAGTDSVQASGGTLEVLRRWRPLDTDLKPVGYTYAVPSVA